MTEPLRTDFNLFLSHQWRDKAIAEQLAGQLRPFASVWMDYRNLRPGDQIQPSIDAALRTMDMVVVLWSPHSAASAGVRAEIETALRLGVTVVPCFATYDGRGNIEPPWPGEWGQPLGVDLRHRAAGAAMLAEQIVHLKNQRLPEEHRVGGPRARLLEHLRGYLNYLANYRTLANVADERSFWIDKIVGELTAYVTESGDRESAEMLLQAARASVDTDPEGMAPLITAMEQALGIGPSAPVQPPAGPQPAPTAAQVQWQPPPAPDDLAARISAVVPPGTAADWTALVHRYIASAQPALGALNAYAAAAQSPAGVQVTAVLAQYLQEGDDLIPDHLGPYGLLDDAWLILNTAFRLIESGLVPVASVPIDWQSVTHADAVVRAVIPPAALATLEQYVMQLLQVIAQEVASYDPWFTPTGAGYSPVMAGGSWEDQMNQALLGTGLSF